MYDTPVEAISCMTGFVDQPCSKCVANPNRSSPARAVTHPMAKLSSMSNGFAFCVLALGNRKPSAPRVQRPPRATFFVALISKVKLFSTYAKHDFYWVAASKSTLFFLVFDALRRRIVNPVSCKAMPFRHIGRL